jgi:hypothetical protein
MSDPIENKSAAGGDWLDEEIVIPTLEGETPAEPVAEVPPVEEEATEVPAAKEAEDSTENLEAKEEAKTEAAVEEEPAPAEAEPAVEEVANKVATQIPKKRFDQVNNRLKAAEERLRANDKAVADARKAQETGEVPRDDMWFGEQEKSYMEAVVDGEVDKAMEIRQTIRSAEQSKFQAYADQKAEYVQKEVPQRAAVESVINDLQDMFPALDKNDESFQPELISEVLGLQRSYMNSDKLTTPAQALQKAAARLGMDLDSEPAVAPAAAPVAAAPVVAAAPASLSDAAGAVATANAQPPEIGSRAGYDNGEDEIDWSTFSEEDLEKLPLSKQRELRGDGGRG